MRWLAFLVTVPIVIAVAYFILSTFLRRLRGRSHKGDFRLNDVAAWRQRWTELEELLDGAPMQWQVAILEADKLLDRVLKSMHLPGQDTGERLRFITRSRPELSFVWQARRVRNRMAHESNYELDYQTAKLTMQQFKRAFEELGVL